MKKRLSVIGSTALLLILTFSGCVSDKDTFIDFNAMTFEVIIPNNTVKEDTVYIYVGTQEGYQMEKIGDYKYKITLNKTQLGIDEQNESIIYRYSRNGHNFNTAEYLEPDTNEYFWTELGRTTMYVSGETQKDMVKRWRWFPPSEILINRTSDIIPKGEFLPRINNIEFRSGQVIEDLYEDAFYDFFNSTAQHMKEQGYNWVIIDPPWQWIEIDGLPRVENLYETNPNYPDDQTLINHINAFKKQGLNIMLGPQLCCDPLTYENRDDEWWSTWFNETKKFLVHHAKIAEESNVDALFYATGTDYTNSDVGTRWGNVYQAIRDEFNGEIGEMVWNFGSEGKTTIPDADFITWDDVIDFFYVHFDAPLTNLSNPTEEELKVGAGRIIDSAKELYERFGKPVFVQTTYFNIKQTWLGNIFYDIASIGGTGSPEKGWQNGKYEFSSLDQARLINAFFEAIAERPWVIGLAQFGYMHWEMPLLPQLSVRGKPSEDIWHKWNNIILSGDRI